MAEELPKQPTSGARLRNIEDGVPLVQATDAQIQGGYRRRGGHGQLDQAQIQTIKKVGGTATVRDVHDIAAEASTEVSEK